MTYREIQLWIESAERVTNTWDSDGRNNYRTYIYKKDGLLYAIQYCNDRLMNRWNGRGYVDGEYEPIFVTKSTRPVEMIREEWTDAHGKMITSREGQPPA